MWNIYFDTELTEDLGVDYYILEPHIIPNSHIFEQAVSSVLVIIFLADVHICSS